MALGLPYKDEEWPQGMECNDCGRPFKEGDHYAEVLDSMIDDIPFIVIVCVACASVRIDRERNP